MNGTNVLLSRLRDLGDGVLLQEQPYPVAAPQSIEQAMDCVAAARAEACVVMPLGSGSSFPKDFRLLRERLLAVMTVRLQGVRQTSPFALYVLSGTSVAAVVGNHTRVSRKTLGGLIAGARAGTDDFMLRLVWRRTRAVDVITGDGRLLTFAGPARCGVSDNLASWLIGSRGKLGLIVSVDLAPPLPLHVSESSEESIPGSLVGSVDGDSVLGSGDLRSRMDPHGLFQW